MAGFKCIIVGDYSVGKTSLLAKYLKNEYPDYPNQLMNDQLTATTVIDNKSYTLHLLDATGGEEYDRLRPLVYPGTDIFLVCFSVDSPRSFASIGERWIPELLHHCPKVPCILVGTKIDLRQDPACLTRLEENGEKFITFEEGERLARDSNVVRYMECSAETEEGLKEVFDTAAIAASMNPIKRKKKHNCKCL